jgi:alpha-galactosidase/6-phospho-beta-glucosidase family protein
MLAKPAWELKLALLNHPLVGDSEIIHPMLDKLIAAHGLWKG